MQPTRNGTLHTSQMTPEPIAHPPSLPPCPTCLGQLVFLRNFYRCVRCGFCICVGCEDLPGAGMASRER